MFRNSLYVFLLLFWFFNYQADAQTLDFTTENVAFQSAGVILKGTIFKPKQPQAAIILVHGSGQERRMTQFATLLAKEGMMVLTYDKRGVAESGGTYAGPEVGTNNIDSANLNLLAADASAAVSLLSTRLPPSNVRIGLMGFSQAGWIIPVAAKKNNKVSFMVFFSGPVVTAREQLRFQFYTQSKTDFWDYHTEDESRSHIKNDPDRYQFSDTDPRKALMKLSIPGLWLFGTKDVQIPVQLSQEHIEKLKSQGKRYECRLFSGLGHNTTTGASMEPFNASMAWIRALRPLNDRKKQGY